MSALADLKRKLSRTNVRTFDGLAFDQVLLQREIKALSAWVGGKASLKPPSDLIIQSLLQFSSSSTLLRFRDAQLVCHGCTEPFGQEKRRLIEDAGLFPKLLSALEQYRSKPRAFRHCFKGLLSGYLAYNPETVPVASAGRKNWQILRQYLNDHLSEIKSPDFEPDWVGAIIEHENLLTENPCGRYDSWLLDDHEREFQELKRKLDISNASWVVTWVVLNQVDSVCSQNDTKFLQYVSRLLALVDEHPLVLDRALSLILERHHRCEGPPSNNALCDFAVTHWGNPWLSLNSTRWDRVSQSATGRRQG
jgi:hypothetical protein